MRTLTLSEAYDIILGLEPECQLLEQFLNPLENLFHH